MLGLAAAVNPPLALGAAIAIAALAAFVRRGEVAVCGFAGATYFDIASAYTGAAFSPIKLAGGALVLLAALTLVVRARRGSTTALGGDPVAQLEAETAPGWRRHPLLVALALAFVTWAIVSAAWAVNLEQVRTLGSRLVTDVLVFLAVPVFVQRTRHLLQLGWTMLACAAMSYLLGIVTGADLLGRALGTFTDPNEFAAALVPAIAIGLPLSESASSTLARATGRGLVAVCTAGVLASGSRGGMLALVVVFATVLLTSRGRERVRLLGASLMCAAGGLAWLVLTPAGSNILARMSDHDSSGRSELWKVAVRQFQQHPVHGIGLGNYPALARNYLDGIAQLDLFLRDPRVVHSTPLELLAELGAVGATLYYAFVLGCLVVGMRAVRVARRSDDAQLTAVIRGVVAALVGTMATTVFLSGQYQELAWVLLASCLAGMSVARREAALRDARSVLGDGSAVDASPRGGALGIASGGAAADGAPAAAHLELQRGA